MNKHRFILHNRDIAERASQAILALPHDPPMEVIVRPWKNTRSRDQNDLYWAILTKISGEIGHSVDELHEIMKMQFLGYDRIQYKDMLIERPRSTTKLTKKEFSDFVEQVMVWAASEFGVTV